MLFFCRNIWFECLKAKICLNNGNMFDCADKCFLEKREKERREREQFREEKLQMKQEQQALLSVQLNSAVKSQYIIALPLLFIFL